MSISEASAAGGVSGNWFVKKCEHVIACLLSQLRRFIDFLTLRGKRGEVDSREPISSDTLDRPGTLDHAASDDLQLECCIVSNRGCMQAAFTVVQMNGGVSNMISDRYEASEATVVLASEVEGLSDDEKLKYIRRRLSKQDEDFLLGGTHWPKGWGKDAFDRVILPGEEVAISDEGVEQLTSWINADRSINH